MGKYLRHEHDLGDLARNPDPITGAAGSHPAGVGIGAASGAVTGAALGALGGPLGAVFGVVAGAVVGGYTGKAAGEWRDPTEDFAFRLRHFDFDGPAYVAVGDVPESYDDGFVEPRRLAAPADAVPAGVFDRPAFPTRDFARPAVADEFVRAADQRLARTARREAMRSSSL